MNRFLFSERTCFAVIGFFSIMAVPGSAYAYLDPGSGSILIYALSGIVATLVYSLRGVVNNWFYLLFRLEKGSGLRLDAGIIIHSEGPQYDHLFLPLLHALTTGKNDDEHNKIPSVCYVTQYERTGNLEPLPKGVIHRRVGEGIGGFVALNKAKAKIFVTTTPQLDVMMFKRSPGVGHYAYLFHAPTDIAPYKPFAFDFFDSILCVGDFMRSSFRALEKARKTKPKRLFSTGVLYYDRLARSEPREKLPASAKPTVLIAASWGRNGLFTRYGSDFLRRLTGDYQVVVRPHPQIAASQPEIHRDLVLACDAMAFELDESPSNEKALECADLLVSDFSGAIYDFHYLHQKPIVIMDTRLDFEAFEGRLLPKPLWQETTRKRIGTIIDEERLDQIDSEIQKALISRRSAPNLRDRYLANFGNAAEVAAGQIKTLWTEAA